MKLLIINGSSSPTSTNQKLINWLISNYPNKNIQFFDISTLPLFRDQEGAFNNSVLDWTSKVDESDGLIISSPEYLHNIPAALKNALEWLNKSSNLQQKKVLLIIFTPKEPRGNKAMQALIWSLQSLQSEILPSLHLFHDDFTSVNDTLLPNKDTAQLLDAALEYWR